MTFKFIAVLILFSWSVWVTESIFKLNDKPTVSCSNMIAVMTPQGHATSVCAP